jgi:D-3-phosphoglycerate dehydrogenase
MKPPNSPPSGNVRTPVVLVADKLDPDGVRILEQQGVEVRVKVGLSPEDLVAEAREVDGILVRSAAKITAEVLGAGTRLRAVGRAGIGVDNIDIPTASRHGIVVMNTPTANAITTGELALAHLFSLARRIPAANRSMTEGRWDKSLYVGSEIDGKILGVVGLGKIGRVVAERACGLGLNVIAFDPFIQGDCPVASAEMVDWDGLLSRADFISVHVPKNKDTLGLFDAAAFGAMKAGAYFINCARGGIVVEDDLVAALASGHLAGAALDVFETEPLPADSPLRAVDNLVLTPHLGASSDEAQKRVSTEIAQQMADYLLRDEARSALNAPAVSPDTLTKLRPYISLGRRLGLMLGQIASDPIERIEIDYVGRVAEMDTGPVRVATLAGVMAPFLDGPVNAVNAELIGQERGLKVLESREPGGDSEYASLLKLRAWTTSGAEHMAAGSVFRGQPRLLLFEDFGVDFVPQGELLTTRHKDTPGVLGQLAGWLGERGVNIGGMHMAPSPEGKTDEPALALFQIDRALTAEEERQLTDIPAIVSARSITF